MTSKAPEFDVRPLRRAMNRMSKVGVQARRSALRISAEAINSEAQVRSPVLSGHMKEQHIVDGGNPDSIELGVNTPYAARQHEGHKARRRWYLKALVEQGPKILADALRLSLASSHGRSR